LPILTFEGDDPLGASAKAVLGSKKGLKVLFSVFGGGFLRGLRLKVQHIDPAFAKASAFAEATADKTAGKEPAFGIRHSAFGKRGKTKTVARDATRRVGVGG
jgi:hypothetical protein